MDLHLYLSKTGCSSFENKGKKQPKINTKQRLETDTKHDTKDMETGRKAEEEKQQNKLKSQ